MAVATQIVRRVPVAARASIAAAAIDAERDLHGDEDVRGQRRPLAPRVREQQKKEGDRAHPERRSPRGMWAASAEWARHRAIDERGRGCVARPLCPAHYKDLRMAGESSENGIRSFSEPRASAEIDAAADSRNDPRTRILASFAW